MTIAPVRNRRGKIVEFLALKMDVTDQIAIEERQAFLAAIVEHMDLVNNRLVWDEQMFQLYGIDEGRFTKVFDAWRECRHPEDKSRAHEEIQAALRGERV